MVAIDDPARISGDLVSTGDEDSAAITGTLIATDVEGLTGDTIYSITEGNSPSDGVASIDGATGLWSYTPSADFDGSDTFTVTVTDDLGGTTVQTISILVVAVDSGDATFSITGLPVFGQTLTATLTSSDPDGDGSETPKYIWQRSTDGSNWKAAGRRDSLQISQKHIGEQLRLQVRYRDSEGFKETVIITAGEVTAGLLLPDISEQITTTPLSSAYQIGNVNVSNVIMGTTSIDKLKGTKQSDLITGDLNKDKLSGGRGKKADVFLINTDQLGRKYADQITGFDEKQGDLIALDLESFQAGPKTTFKTVKNTKQLNKMAGGPHELIYDKRQGELYFNENGKAKGLGDDGGLLAILKGAPKLSNKQLTYLELLSPGINLPKPDQQVSTTELISAFKIGKVNVQYIVMGTAKKDKLTGTKHSDLIVGDRKKDKLTSGKGKKADVFLLSTDQLGRKHADVITDFQPIDMIALDLGTFTQGSKTRFAVVKNTKQLDKIASSRNELIYDKSKAELFFNENGKQEGFGDDGGLLATFKGAPKLSKKQFTFLDLLVSAAASNPTVG